MIHSIKPRDSIEAMLVADGVRSRDDDALRPSAGRRGRRGSAGRRQPRIGETRPDLSGPEAATPPCRHTLRQMAPSAFALPATADQSAAIRPWLVSCFPRLRLRICGLRVKLYSAPLQGP